VRDQVVQFSFGNDRTARLRAAALNSMVLALEALDGLGDELPAAATLQHAIDRLSYRKSDFDKIIALDPPARN
jgi:hypothetical protein